jgi:monoterpene epsilon-lactone hydrolase
MRTPDPRAALPEWARFVPESVGAWRRRLLNAILRITVKSQLDAETSVGVARGANARLDRRFAWVEPGMRRTPDEAGGVPGEWVDAPGSRAERTVLYLRGGAFMFRFPRTHAGLAARIAARTGARVFLPDYRLAPEHPHPAAGDDCLAAYRGLLGRGTSASSMAFVGDSAGGNLVLALLHRLKAAGGPLPACAVAFSPIVDFTMSSPSLVANERRDPAFTLAAVLAMRPFYAPPERFLDPDVSPLFGDWAGLPPLLFQVGSTELLLDESVRAAERARAAGVAADLEVWDRLPHVFQAIAMLPQSAAALDSAAHFLRRHCRWND